MLVPSTWLQVRPTFGYMSRKPFVSKLGHGTHVAYRKRPTVSLFEEQRQVQGGGRYEIPSLLRSKGKHDLPASGQGQFHVIDKFAKVELAVEACWSPHCYSARSWEDVPVVIVFRSFPDQFLPSADRRVQVSILR